MRICKIQKGLIIFFCYIPGFLSSLFAGLFLLISFKSQAFSSSLAVSNPPAISSQKLIFKPSNPPAVSSLQGLFTGRKPAHLAPNKVFLQAQLKPNKKPKPSSLKDPLISSAKKALYKVLRAYGLKQLEIKIEQEIFLSAINSTVKSRGRLHLNQDQFYMKLKGNPSSLLLFDGQTLWYQADISEKLVFKSQNPSDIQLLSSFFDKKALFKAFKIQKAVKEGQGFILQLKPKQEIKGLSQIFMKFETYISEIRIIWEDLDNWQKYKLSKPVYKKPEPKIFQFSIEGFQVINKTDF